MARPYETAYIFDSALEEAQINEKLEGFHALLGGTDQVRETAHWGKRKLAYAIGTHTAGYYVLVKFETDPTKLAEYERALKLDDAVLRYLVVIDEGTPIAQHPVESDDVKPSQRRIHYKDERLLMKLTTDRGKILPRRLSRMTAVQQRQLARAVKRARYLAILSSLGSSDATS